MGTAAAVLGLGLVFLMLSCEVAQAATYTVGDAGGWAFNVVGWPNGKSFKAGDTLGMDAQRFSKGRFYM